MRRWLYRAVMSLKRARRVVKVRAIHPQQGDAGRAFDHRGR